MSSNVPILLKYAKKLDIKKQGTDEQLIHTK